MPKLKQALLMVGVLALIVAPVYGGEAVDATNSAVAAEADEVDPSAAGVQLHPLFLAAGGGDDDLAGFLISEGSGGITALCEEYTINCIEEEDDTCCANLEQCLDYCEDVCNGPCAPA